MFAVLGVLFAIGMTVTAGSREKARQSACAANLRSIGIAGALYASENNDADPVDPQVPAPRMFYGNPDLIKTKVGLATMYCPDFPPCARRHFGSGYAFFIAPLRPVPEEKPKLEASLREKIERLGNDFPLVLCLAHDETFYQPKEADLAEVLNPPFALWLRADGSVGNGRLSVRRSHNIERYCRVPAAQKP